MNGAEALVRGMEREGVKHVFGILGGAILDVYDVLYDNSSIRHFLCRHEQVAAYAANGYAQASGKTGTCMATSGPGACNMVTGIADAYMDSRPVVAITGQVPTTLMGKRSFQEADILAITAPITKHNYLVKRAVEVSSTVRSAYGLANSGRPGPVLIDLPKDVQKAKATCKTGKAAAQTFLRPNKQKVLVAVKALMNAERPVILAGGGVIISNSSSELVRLAELLDVPVATTAMGKGAIPEDHSLGLGMLGMYGNKWANLAIQESDAIFAIGTRFSDRITGDPKGFAPHAKITHADVDKTELGKNIHADLKILGDAKFTLHEMLLTARKLARKEATNLRKNTEWGAKLELLKREFRQRTDFDSTPIKPQRIIHEVQKIIDRNPNKTIITTEVGRNQLWSMHYLNIREPRNWITSGGLGCMGAGFPMAIGAQVARPDCRLLNMAGDGSFQMTMQDLATCTTYDLPIVNVIFDDASLGNVRMLQALFYKKRYSQTDLEKNPDFLKLADAYGAFGIKVERPGEIKDALQQALESGKPAIVDVMIDRDEVVYPLVPPGGTLDKMLE